MNKILLPFAALAALLLAPDLLAGPLADAPLFLGQQADSNVLLNLSVEWPTAETAAYTDTSTNTNCPGQPTDNTLTSGGSNVSTVVGVCYFPTTAYVGYFDPAKCYNYVGTTGSNGHAASGYFAPTGPTRADHSCNGMTGSWSGNFLNWATMTAIDVFRSAMSGGNRDVDATGSEPRTVLRRSMKYRGPDDYVFRIKRLGASSGSSLGVASVAPSTVSPSARSIQYYGNTSDELRLFSATEMNNYTSYQVRVQVCLPTMLESNCTTYPGTGTVASGGTGTVYKPTGLIQNNSTHMRFAATGYLNEGSFPPHWGGVLRARMNYAGPTMFVPGTGTVTNANTEWNAQTGVLNANPDPNDASASGVSQSGVINYLNKFGYNANYKSYDTFSELYYVGLEYFKHLSPNSEAWSSLTTAMKDGFPVITNWDDPIQLSCQQNFIIAIGDSNCWCDSRLPGTSVLSGGCSGHNGNPSSSDGAIDVTYWTNKLGGLEGIGNIGNGLRSSRSDTYYVAGLAYYAHTQDIRPDDSSQPQTIGKQTITTYMIDVQEPGSWFGTASQYWLAAKYGGFLDSNGTGIPPNTASWSQDGVNPSNYFGANRPDLLVAGLNNVFFNIAALTGSGASLGANGRAINGGFRVYQSEFTTSDWSGHLRAFGVDTFGNVAPTPDWDAGSILTSQLSGTGWGSRLVYTFNNSSASTSGCQAWSGCNLTGGQFANLNAAQQAALNTNLSAVNDGYGAQRLNWLLGDSTNEGRGTNFRARANKLGDIVDSSPVYVGPPSATYNGVPTVGYDDPTYISFANSYATRTPIVYVGANDGMLHGFNASSGSEVMAYIPAGVYGNLAKLTSPNYSHKYFVDGTPQINDAQIGGAWKTVLVGSLRGGGQGVFALDVTDPTAYTGANARNVVLWEFTDQNDADLGFTFSDATVVKTNIKDASGNYRWAAVIGNGYNDTQSDGAASSGGVAAVYVLFLDGGKNGTWTAGTDYVKLTANSSGPASPNGMATPAVTDEDGNGTADFIYAGDLNGNLWKFDVRGTSTTQWKSFYDSAVGQASTPLYVAMDASGTRQPITTAPEVVGHPKGGNFVLFGTGKMLEPGDPLVTGTQTMYGVWDRNTTPVTGGRGALQQQTTLATQLGPGGATYRVTSANSVNWATQMGWYMDFPNSAGGERLIYSPIIDFGRVQFITFQPSTAACSGGGTSEVYELDALTGSRATLSPFDVNGDRRFSGLDDFLLGGTGAKIPASAIAVSGAIPQTIRVDLANGTCGTQACERAFLNNLGGLTISKDIKKGRLTWREIGKY
jgi:type IV pilus assembly protein PilY1